MAFVYKIEELANQVFQPNNIAIVVSASLHVGIAVALPQLQGSEGPGRILAETVPIVELTPEQQSKLPSNQPMIDPLLLRSNLLSSPNQNSLSLNPPNLDPRTFSRGFNNDPLLSLPPNRVTSLPQRNQAAMLPPPRFNQTQFSITPKLPPQTNISPVRCPNGLIFQLPPISIYPPQPPLPSICKNKTLLIL
ncbi:MAG: hypothetical protein HC796_02140 [Synechococcaceae cyanobacterium RL_1_2]|nr:hypothetical protein [Synechococcaceae cyanobacterium RL_1_2]